MRNVHANKLWMAGFGSLIVAGAVQGCGGATSSNPRSDAGAANGSGGSNPGGGSGSGSGSGASSSTSSNGAQSGSVSSTSSSSSIGPATCGAPIFDAATLPAPSPPICVSVSPASASVATFDAGLNQAFGAFGGPAPSPVAGGFYVFPGCSSVAPEPTDPLGLDTSADVLGVSGIVTTYAGFGIYWSVPVLSDAGPGSVSLLYTFAPLDLSAYAGIQFDIGGDAGPLGVVTFGATSTNQEPSSERCGTCSGDGGMCSVTSTAPVTGLTSVGSPMKTVQIRWTDLTSFGAPFDPTSVANLVWLLSWTPGQPSYPVEVQIDNVRFIPLP